MVTHQATHVAAVVGGVVVTVAATIAALISSRGNDLTRCGDLLPIFEIIINYRLAGGVVSHPVFGDRALALQDESIPTSLLCHGLYMYIHPETEVGATRESNKKERNWSSSVGIGWKPMNLHFCSSDHRTRPVSSSDPPALAGSVWENIYDFGDLEISSW